MVAIPALAPLWSGQAVPDRPTAQPLWSWLLLFLAPLAATILLFLIDISTPTQALGGILIGGALSLWFFMAGFIWLLGGFNPLPGRLTDVALGLGLVVLLTLAFGAPAQLVWAPWFMIPTRLARLPYFVLAMIPWQLAAAEGQNGASWRRRGLFWLGQSVGLGVGLLLAVLLMPDLSFLTLILPLLPVLLAIMTIAGRAFDHRPWAAAIGNAAFFGWTMIVVFPLTG